MVQHDPSMARPIAKGKLIDPGIEGRIAARIQAFADRLENAERLEAIMRAMERRLSALEGARESIYTAKHRSHRKWGVDDVAGEAIETDPLSKDAAKWLAGELNEAGEDIPPDTYSTLVNLAMRKSEGRGGNGKAA